MFSTWRFHTRNFVVCQKLFAELLVSSFTNLTKFKTAPEIMPSSPSGNISFHSQTIYITHIIWVIWLNWQWNFDKILMKNLGIKLLMSSGQKWPNTFPVGEFQKPKSFHFSVLKMSPQQKLFVEDKKCIALQIALWCNQTAHLCNQTAFWSTKISSKNIWIQKDTFKYGKSTIKYQTIKQMIYSSWKLF